MKVMSLLLGAVFCFICSGAAGENASSTAPAAGPKFLIEPTSTAVAGAKANLTISSLSRQEAAFVGTYNLKVSPYFFLNETGKLSMTVPEEALQKLAKGIPVDLTGVAVTDGNGRTRPIVAKATPAGGENGHVSFSFTGEDRKLVFNSKYRISNR